MSSKSRKNARAVVQLVARYRSPTVFNFVEEECYDLSTGGMFIKSPAPAAAGTLLKLECDAEDGEQQVRAVARVVWARLQEDQDGPVGMGVKFIKLEPGGKELIERLIAGRASLVPGGERYRGSSVPPAQRAAVEDGEEYASRPPPVPASASRPPQSTPPADAEVDADGMDASPGSASAEAAEDSNDATAAETASAAVEPAAPSPQAESTDTAGTDTKPAQPSEEEDAASQAKPRGEEKAGVAASPAALSSAQVVAVTPVEAESSKGGGSGWLMAVGAAAVLGGAILFQTMGGGKPTPAESSGQTVTTQQNAAQPQVDPTLQPAVEPGASDSSTEEGAAQGSAVPQEIDEPAEPSAPGEDAREDAPTEAQDTPEQEAPSEGPAEAPTTAPTSESGAAMEPENTATAATSDKPYVISVISRPSGAHVTFLGKETFAPGDITLDGPPGEERIRAEKSGFHATAATIKADDFVDEGEVMRRRIYLVLHPE